MNNKFQKLFIITLLFVFNFACTGGQQRFSSDYYCFDPIEGKLYDPIPVEFIDEKYRKAVFSVNVPSELTKPINELELPVEVLDQNEMGGAKPEINDRIKEIKEQQKQAAEKVRKELNKVVPLLEGEYEYVGGEVYVSQFLPQITSTNKYRRIHVLHQKNLKSGELKFNNKCLSNMPENTSLAPIKTEALTGFKVVNGVVISEAISDYTIRFEDLKIKVTFDTQSNKSNTVLAKDIVNPADYLQKPGLKYQLYKLVDKTTSAFSYELRTHIKQGELDVYVRTLFKFKEPAKEKKASKETEVDPVILEEVTIPETEVTKN